MFVFSRFIGGLSKGNISLSMSVITDVCSESNRNKGMAFVGVAFSLGFIIGPIIGAKFTKMNKEHSEPWFIYPALLACALAICGFIVLRIFLKETLPKVRIICLRKYNNDYIFTILIMFIFDYLL